MNDLNSLLNQSRINRSLFGQKIIASQKSRQGQGVVIGYDADLGYYSVQTVDGTIHQAESITTGAIANGQKVALILGSIPKIKAMPS
ncbi:hypothetical protein [Anabaena lutea]|uniref:Uncharacterized protein n=1 Tax=Anabaena lutea FACHB-196 TaxID=2692881 RepID=A0ABR8FM47_9NOST|nr:hypothetical protein [Anabaena lutea]MBD2570009.1 hypothetical protein [Anabaena lutea FACHB-196]